MVRGRISRVSSRRDEDQIIAAAADRRFTVPGRGPRLSAGDRDGIAAQIIADGPAAAAAAGDGAAADLGVEGGLWMFLCFVAVLVGFSRFSTDETRSGQTVLKPRHLIKIPSPVHRQF
jgi:hypothetical protein